MFYNHFLSLDPVTVIDKRHIPKEVTDENEGTGVLKEIVYPALTASLVVITTVSLLLLVIFKACRRCRYSRKTDLEVEKVEKDLESSSQETIDDDIKTETQSHLESSVATDEKKEIEGKEGGERRRLKDIGKDMIGKERERLKDIG